MQELFCNDGPNPFEEIRLKLDDMSNSLEKIREKTKEISSRLDEAVKILSSK